MSFLRSSWRARPYTTYLRPHPPPTSHHAPHRLLFCSRAGTCELLARTRDAATGILNSTKMSKSTGNFMTIQDCIKEYGADATRLTMADAGDSLDDANFDSAFANAVLLKLFVLEKLGYHPFGRSHLTRRLYSAALSSCSAEEAKTKIK